MRAILVAACLTISLLQGNAQASESAVVARPVAGKFDDVKASVLFAIEGRGLVVNNTAYVGDMLDRTGRDLGATRRLYRSAEVLEFCSAVISRETMEADPHNIAFCPYTIAIYVLDAEPDTVYVSYRRPAGARTEAGARALGSVEQLLSEIVKEALQ